MCKKEPNYRSLHQELYNAQKCVFHAEFLTTRWPEIFFHGRNQFFQEGLTLKVYEIIADTLSLADSALGYDFIHVT
jgi:hypothetical protein